MPCPVSARRQRQPRHRAAWGIVPATLLAVGRGGEGAAPSTPVATAATVATEADPAATAVVTAPAAGTAPSAPTTSAAVTPSETPRSTVVSTTSSTPVRSALADDLGPIELAALRDEVMSDMQEAYDVFDAVRRDPTNAALVAQLATVMTAERVRYVIDTFVMPYVADDLVERTNPDLPARIDFLPDTFDVDVEVGTASIDYCYLSSNLLVELGGNPDGSDEVQDDRFAAVLVHNELVFAGERWLDAGGEDVSVRLGETECG